MSLKRKSHWRRRKKWNVKRICINKEVKAKERGNKRIREDEEDPDISEIEEDIPDKKWSNGPIKKKQKNDFFPPELFNNSEI